MADEARVGVPHWWTAADEDDAADEALECVLGIHTGANNDQVPIRASKIRNAGDRLGTGEQDMSSGEVEKSCNVGDELRRPVAFPGKAPFEAELPRLANGTDDSNNSLLHEYSIDSRSGRVLNACTSCCATRFGRMTQLAALLRCG